MKNQEKRHISNTRSITTKKQKLHLSKKKITASYFSQKGPPRSKIPFRDFRWIRPYLVEKVLPNNNYTVRKLKTNKTQILHRIRLRKYNPETPPEDNYLEDRWQIDDNIVVPQDNLYTFAWEAEFGGHLFDIPIIHTDPNAIDFDDCHTKGPDTVIVPRSYFHDSSKGQNREICPITNPSVPQTPKPKLNGQSQDIETTTDLTQNDNAKHIYESITDAEITCKPVTQPPSTQSDTSSTLDSNNPTAENTLKKESNYSRGGKYNLRPNPKPILLRNIQILMCVKLYSSPFRVPFLFFNSIFCTHII